jgi:hypothetical protein
MEQTVLLLDRQIAVQADFILENHFAGAGPVQPHVRGYGAQRYPMVIRIHSYGHVHAACQGRLQQVVGAEAGMLPAFIDGCIGESLMIAVGKPGQVSGWLACGADHSSIVAGRAMYVNALASGERTGWQAKAPAPGVSTFLVRSPRLAATIHLESSTS